LFLASYIWNACLVSDICIRLWAVIGARQEPYCPARCELILLFCTAGRNKMMMIILISKGPVIR